jgi:hypothetical protein
MISSVAIIACPENSKGANAASLGLRQFAQASQSRRLLPQGSVFL